MTDTNTASVAPVAEEANDLLDMFTSNTDAIENGIWRKVGNKARFRIRALSSKAVQKVIRSQQERLDRVRTSHGGTVPEDVQREADAEFCASMLSDWENVPDPMNRETLLALTPETAKMLVGAPERRKLLNFIIGVSRDEDNYLATEVAAMEGNSAQSSAGN